MIKSQPSLLARWIQGIRVFSLTASVMPVLVGAALAAAYEAEVNWLLLPVALVCAVLYHAATNLISDYFDYGKGVDTAESYGGSRVIVEGLLEPRKVLIGALIMFAAGTMLGLILVAIRGIPMLIIGFIGFLGGLFYTARPVAYKYAALGDFGVFVMMGPMMVIGSFYALTGTYNNEVLLVSLPVGFLVTAILSANNLRDIKQDTQAGIRTMANVLGPRNARLWYYALVCGAYAAVVGMIFAGILPAWSLAVFLTIPLAVRNFRCAHTSDPERAEAIAAMDVQTAQLHLAFGLLLTASILVGAMTQ